MSYGTELFTGVYFNRETYDTLYKVEEAIEETTKRLHHIYDELMCFAMMTDPNKMLSKEEMDGMSPMSYIRTRQKELLEERDVETIYLYKLQMLKDNWDDCHVEIEVENDGVKKKKVVAKNPPEEVYGTSYLAGDFIEGDRNVTEE